MPTWGKAAARTALPHPPKTSQNVPKNSAPSLFVMLPPLRPDTGRAKASAPAPRVNAGSRSGRAFAERLRRPDLYERRRYTGVYVSGSIESAVGAAIPFSLTGPADEPKDVLPPSPLPRFVSHRRSMNNDGQHDRRLRPYHRL